MPFVPNMPPVNYLSPRSDALGQPLDIRTSSGDCSTGPQAPRSHISYPWLLNDASLGYGDFSGYMAPRPPVYASIVSLSGESSRPASYYAQQVSVSVDPEIHRNQERLRNFISRNYGGLFVRNFNTWQGHHLSQPRCRRTVCVGSGFSLPPLLEEDATYGRARSSSVVMGTQAISLSSHKVNNIEKAEQMKALSKMMKDKKDEELAEFQNEENAKKNQSLQQSQSPEDKDDFDSDVIKSENSPSTPSQDDEVEEEGEKGGSSKETPESGIETELAFSGNLTRPRVRLSYVESFNDSERVREERAQMIKKKRSSWAVGEKIHKLPERPFRRKDFILNNARDARNRSRISVHPSDTLYPRTESCVNAPKCKKRLSWASCERKRFSWSPRSHSADRVLERRRYSIAGDEGRRNSVRMGTRSLMSISSPMSGTLVHVAGHGPLNSNCLADILRQNSHNRQETTLVHPVTQKSAVNAEAIHSPSSASALRFEATSPVPTTNTLNNSDARKVQGGSRRRSGGSWVKTPGLKRPDVSPVTLQGWLYKQGADGLHLWKKRWFVLSEYCLYYYKGPDEDKVLGSLPLPSFKISPVDSEDRVYRKNAFKAEHQNLRTYYFAAETKDQMTQWMNALSLASILQKDTSLEEKWSSGSSAHRSERPSVSSLASTASPSADESDSGFHGYRSRRYRSPDGRSLDEASESSRLQGDRLNVSCDSSVNLRPGDRQPLYANAPPKPKRLNSSRDYSTSPEHSPERSKRDPRTYTDHGGGSEVADGRNLNYHPPAAERRTPDAYGVTAGGGRGDYEDVYGDSNGSNPMAQSQLRRPDQRDSFASSRSGGTRLSEELQLSEPLRQDFRGQDDTLPRMSHSNAHHHHRQGPPRPHSADFLEYDRKHGNEMWSYRRGSGGDLPRPNEMRPKSSVGHGDLDHWSEENYAQKMRQSSLYHTHMHSRSSRCSPAGRGESPSSDHHILHNSHNVAQRIPPAGAATPDLYTPHKPSSTLSPSSTTNSLRRGAVLDARHHQRPPDPCQDFRVDSTKLEPRQDSRYPPRQDMRPDYKPDLTQDPYKSRNHDDSFSRYEPSPNSTLNNVPTPPGSSCHNSISPNESLNNSFLRSASARLPRQRLQDDVMNMSLPDDGSDGDSKKMQQREESMKRLLEWKQRMLQSPLTRKSSPRPDASTTPQLCANSEAYKQQVLNELVTQEARTKSVHGHAHTQSLLSGSESVQKGSQGAVGGLPHQYSPTPMSARGGGGQGGWMPGDHSNYRASANAGSALQSHPNQTPDYPSSRIPNERPAPQGGSSQPGSDSGGSSKRREGRREASRTRHVSGGDSRRSTSASRYNSYSSDEEDLLGERETRKRTRRSFRRSSVELTREGRRSAYLSESKGSSWIEGYDPSQEKNEVPRGDCTEEHQRDLYAPQKVPSSSPDYVNINIVSEVRENKLREANNGAPSENSYNERTLSQRAEPVFIENHDGYDEVKRFDLQHNKTEQPLSAPRNFEQSYVYNDHYYATRDPYYVSDVQLPAVNDKYEDEKSIDSSFDHMSHKDHNVSSDTQTSQTNIGAGKPKQIHDNRNVYFDSSKNSGMPMEGSKEFQSIESSAGYASYDSHIAHKIDSLNSHTSHRVGMQDDTTSTGKYSDSGYDTLRAEIPVCRDDKKNNQGSVWSPDSLDNSHESSSVVRRRGMDRVGRRPESWSPDKFDRSWGGMRGDPKSRVDESKVVKEYSYEYITPEKNHESFPDSNLKNISNSLKKSSSTLPSLESPKMVHETDQQTQSQVNLVQDRIKKFTGKMLDTKENSVNNCDSYFASHSKSVGSKSKLENSMEEATYFSDFSNAKHKEPLKEPLKPISPQIKSSEALVSPLKAEFATSESTVVTAQEAQVKNVSDYKKRDDICGSPVSDDSSPLNHRYTSCVETPNMECRELRSPQDIMDSRLSRTNIRKFLFDEDTKPDEQKNSDRVISNVKPPLMKKPTQTRSVKALLKNFEERSIEHMERVNMNRDSSRRKFHSDSEMLSNESSSDEEPCEDIYGNTGEKVTISPTTSVLADLRKSADDKKEPLPLVPPPRPPKKPTLRGEMDVVMTPGYLRLSLADSIQESLKVEGDTDSGGEEPSWVDTNLNIDQRKQSLTHVNNNDSLMIDLDKPPEEEAPPPPFYAPSEFHGPLQQPYAEENYLPMSPPKKLSHGSGTLGPGSSCSSLSSKHLPTPEPVYPDTFAKTEYEEHTYIEMNGDTTSTNASVLAMNAPGAPRLDLSKISNDMFVPESPRYYEIGDKDEPQHYEYIYKGQSHYEAIYMEVPNSEKEEKPKIPDKPSDFKSEYTTDRKYPSDILNSSISKMDKSQSNASSDADDEASKDLDSLEPPRNPRFSLSDTFRPASYYLSGAEPSSDPDAQDSSDSDLVPPPPIPLSPPPMDDLDTGGPKAKNFDFENLETPDPPPHLRNALSSSRSLRINHDSVREDSPNCPAGKDKRIYDQTESSSLLIDKLKRRPVFEETLGSLNDEESFILRSEDRYPASAAYPEDCNMTEPDKMLQRERRKPFPQCSEDILLPGDKHEPSARPKFTPDPPTSVQSNLDSTFGSPKHENPYVNDGFQHNARPNFNSYQNSARQSTREYTNVPPNSKILMQMERERSNSTGSRPKSPDPYTEQSDTLVNQSVSAHRTSLLRKSSVQIAPTNSESTGSPMIDALRGIHSPVSPLNISHQRTSSEVSSRGVVVSPTSSILSAGGGNIGPIHLRGASNASVGSETSPRSAPYYYSDVIRDESPSFADGLVGTPRIRSYQLNNQRDLEANKRQDIGRKVNQITSASEFEQRRERLAHELKTSVEFLEGKTVSSPDERNVYDSDTLRKMKRRAYTPDPELDAKNVFPYGLSIKSDGPTSPSVVGHRRTRSLEGLLDDPSRPFPNNGCTAVSPDPRPMPVKPSSQVSNLVKPGVPQIATSAPLGMRKGHGSSVTTNPSPPSVITSPRNTLSPVNNQRTSVSSLQSSGSVPPGATSPYATSPLPVSPIPPYPVGSRDSLVSRESSASRISYHDTRSPHDMMNTGEQGVPLENPCSYSHDQAAIHEGQDWEDDSQWREQLRRASLRHTRSLETLDENRPRRPGDGINGESRPPARLSVPNYPSQVTEESNHQRLKQLQLDEYTVDYREGRVGPNHYRGSSVQNSETLERTRRGLTCLEGYEWDENEEKFKKPNQTVRFRQPLPQPLHQNSQNQSFLADGLPPSPEMECEEQCQEQENPTLPLAHGPASPRPLQQQPSSADGDEDGVSSLGAGGRPQNEEECQEEQPTASSSSSPAPEETNDAITNATPQPVPDVVPASDVKLGDSLPRRPDSKAPNSAPSQGSTHAHGLAQNYQHMHMHQNYQHHPHPHTQNPYHHYKSDELHKHCLPSTGQNYQSNGPYSNYHGSSHGYSSGYQEDHVNYPNKYRETHTRPSNYQDNQQQNAREDYNNTLSSQHSGYRQHTHYDFQDYHNYKNHQDEYKNHIAEYKNQDYGTYGRHHRPHDQRLNGRLANDTHQQYSDSEITMSKQQQQQPQVMTTSSVSVPSIPLAQQDTGVEVRGLQGVSAGELLGKTHEELVLLLIQLRRHHSALQAARRHARLERDSQGRLAHLDTEHRQEHLRRLASLNHHLHDLDKQYEMGKPLINLVDNMVKLGSLYRGGDARLTHDPRRPNSYHIGSGYDSLQFSRRIQERRIVAEDLQVQEYELAAADQSDLEGKVMQLYKLDKNLHQESLTIQSLQREKKLEETAAENSRLEHEMMMLRQKIQMAMAKNSQRESGSSSETRHIESEMVRVQTLLEDLQRRRIELSHQIQRLTSANPGIEIRPSPTGVVGAAPVPARRRTQSTWLETDLDAMVTRDRGLDLPETGRRGNPPVYVNASRYEDERLPTDYPESPDFNDSDYPPPPPPPEHMRTYNHHQLAKSPPSPGDLLQNDSRYIHGIPSYEDSRLKQPLMNGDIGNPALLGLDRDAEDNKPDGEEQQHSGSHLDISDADDRMKRYYGILPKEKPLEIKTVRIVKRESTERKKDRTTTGGKRVMIGDSLTNVAEDDAESEEASDGETEPAIPAFSSRSASLPRNYGRNGPGERVSMMAAMMRTSVGNTGTMTRPSNLALKKSAGWKAKNENPKDRPMSAHEQLFGFSREADQTPPSSPSKSDPPSPVFKSAAAQQIIKEMASEAEKHRRTVPKEKRRHFTISSSQPLALETRDTGADEGARSRDDCDMVRALRPRNHPDVVKSTLSSRDLRFNETTIDSVLGAPDKIYIPERYMPDEDDEKEPTEEERVQREQKAESIRKMLSETQTTVTADVDAPRPDGETPVSSSLAFKAKLAAEKKEREHLLALNQILARQVMEKSRVVAVRALTMLTKQPSSSDDDLSPMQPLPLVQQRENYLV
ncbi:uncharacterized protein [Macrobrachium rosenbergii]|uniref:uncharacterized protein isoform X6 n=1 Tax=Macrobrachium rosenbergii TaxID=79674 RepID=UPI0034D5CD75